MATTTATTSHIYRCYACLQGYASGDVLLSSTRCVCGGVLEHRGQVNGGRLIDSFQAPPCDWRCTEAISDKCSCQCQGKNHGSHLIVTVRRDSGAAPTVEPADPEACKARAAEFHAAIAAVWAGVETRFPGALERRRAGLWLERAAFDAILDAERLVQSARRLTNHANRLKKLGS